MTQTHAPAHGSHRPQVDAPDVREFGAAKDGIPQTLDKRLFMQFQAFTGCLNPEHLLSSLRESKLESVLYLDIHDARGVGLLLVTEDPAMFAEKGRHLLLSEAFAKLEPKPEYTMLGRTYSSGHEQDLEDWLLWKPRRNLSNDSFSWAVWYPLKRRPEFEILPKEDQRKILMEHAKLGMGYGAADLAHDVRLACHGLDRKNNEFVIGIVARDLHPISRLVQDMRKTEQTAKYIESMGPFFVGKAICSSVKAKP